MARLQVGTAGKEDNMAVHRSPATVVALTFGVALLAGASCAEARGGGGGGGGFGGHAAGPAVGHFGSPGISMPQLPRTSPSPMMPSLPAMPRSPGMSASPGMRAS